MTRLSVNINKIATLRNSRGGDNPNVLQVAMDCERFGAQGITVHPRPDERHIRRSDVIALKPMITTEFNIEGYPDDRFIQLIEIVKPHQVTLVPDKPDAITSNAGWDTEREATRLRDAVDALKKTGTRISIFINPIPRMAMGAHIVGADRIELYTEPYAVDFPRDKHKAVAPYIETAHAARACGLGVNAGHDLDLKNLRFLRESLPCLDEVSIGHALIAQALYFGLENTIGIYLRQLQS